MSVNSCRRRHLLAILFGLLAGTLVAVSVFVEAPIYSFGGDGVFSLCAGVNLASGKGITDCWGRPFIGNPPFMPLVLGLPIAAGLEPIDALRLASILFAAVGGYCATRLLGLALRSSLLFILASLSAVVHPTLVLWATVSAQSDFYMAVLGSVLLLALVQYLRGRLAVGWLAAAAVSMMSVRYFSLPAMVVLGVAMISPLNPRPVGRRWLHAVAVAAAVAIFLGGWMFRNWLESSCATNCFAFRWTPFLPHLRNYFFEMAGWQFYLPGLAPIRGPLFATAFLVAVAAGSVLWRRSPREGQDVWWIALGYWLLYGCLTLFVYTAIVTGEPMNQRYVLPLASTVLLIFAIALDRMIPPEGMRRKAALAAVGVIWAVWLFLPAKSVWATMTHRHGFFADGITVTSRTTRQSTAVRTMRRLAVEAPLYAANDETVGFALFHIGLPLPLWHGNKAEGPAYLICGKLYGGVFTGINQTALHCDVPKDATVIHDDGFAAIYAMR